MFTDKPVEQINDDKLGRAIFAKEIAEGIVKSFGTTYESVVIGINGPWGSGKSSLVNLIVQQIECLAISEESRIVVMRFNPWMFSGQRELQEIFLRELVLKLRGMKGKIKSASEKLAEFAEYLTWVKYVHNGAGEFIKDSQEFLKHVSKKKDLSELKKEVDDILIKHELKLYITIDDIDRLTPAEITQIFQLVKLNANFANTFFILVYDRDVVVKALQNQFEGNGVKYIEKIVQIDYTVPEVSRKAIASVLRDTLGSLFADETISTAIQKAFLNLPSEPFVESLTSLRDVYRFCNAIKLRLGSIYDQLNIRDFFVIEILRIFHYEVYEFIMKSKLDLTQKDSTERFFVRRTNDAEATPAQFIEKSGFDENLKKLLRGLFALESTLDSSWSPESLIVQRRVANRAYFDRYFSLQLSDQDIPEGLFYSFIDSDEMEIRLAILEKVRSIDCLHQYLQWLQIKLDDFNNRKIETAPVIQAVLEFSNTSHWNSPHFGVESELLCIHRFCSRMLDGVKEVKVRQGIVTKYLATLKEPTFASVQLCSSILDARQLYLKEKNSSGFMWSDLFAEEDVKNATLLGRLPSHLAAGTIYLFKKAMSNDDFLNNDELLFVINQLYKFHRTIYDVEFPKFLENGNVLLRVLLMCITSRSVSGNGAIRFSLTKSQFFDGMDIQRVHDVVTKMDRDKLSEIENLTIKFFLNAHQHGFQKELYFDFSDPSDSLPIEI